MKDKAKGSQHTPATGANTSTNGAANPSSAKTPTKEYETHKSPAKPRDKAEKRLGESETEIDDETTI